MESLLYRQEMVVTFDTLVGELVEEGFVVPEDILSTMRTVAGYGYDFYLIQGLVDLMGLITLQRNKANTDVSPVDEYRATFKDRIKDLVTRLAMDEPRSLEGTTYTTGGQLIKLEDSGMIMAQNVGTVATNPLLHQLVQNLIMRSHCSLPMMCSSLPAQVYERIRDSILYPLLFPGYLLLPTVPYVEEPPSDDEVDAMCDAAFDEEHGIGELVPAYPNVIIEEIIAGENEDVEEVFGNPIQGPQPAFNDRLLGVHAAQLRTANSWANHTRKFALVSARGALDRMRRPVEIIVVTSKRLSIPSQLNVDLKFKCEIICKKFSRTVYSYKQPVAVEKCSQLFLKELAIRYPALEIPHYTEDERLLIDLRIFEVLSDARGLPGNFETSRVERTYTDGRATEVLYLTDLHIPIVVNGQEQVAVTHDESSLYLYAKAGAARMAYSNLLGSEYTNVNWGTVPPTGVRYIPRRFGGTIVLPAVA